MTRKSEKKLGGCKNAYAKRYDNTTVIHVKTPPLEDEVCNSVGEAARALKVLRAMKLGGLMQAIEEQMVRAQSATVGFQLCKMATIMMLAAHVIATPDQRAAHSMG